MWDSTQVLYFGASSGFLFRNNKQVSVIWKINTDVSDSTFEGNWKYYIVSIVLYLYKFTKYVSHNLFHWTLPLPLKGGTTASQGGMTGHTLLLVSLHTSRHCSNWMRLTRWVNAVAGFIELCVQSPVLSPKTFKQLNVSMFAIEYLNNVLFHYQTISCTNKQCLELECEPATLPLYCL